MHLTSPVLLGEEEINDDRASFVLSAGTLEEILSSSPSHCSTTEESVGLCAIRWQRNPHQYQMVDAPLSQVLNVSSLSATRCGGELAVQNLSSAIQITLPAVPHNIVMATDENSTECSLGDWAIVACNIASDRRFNVTCLESRHWNISCGIHDATTSQCLWYDGASHTWLADGCHPISATPDDGAATVSCECSHLTSFAGSIGREAVQGFTIISVLGGGVGEEELRESVAILCLILGVYGIAGTLFWSDWARLKARSKLHKQSIYASPKCQASIDWLSTFTPHSQRSESSIAVPSRKSDVGESSKEWIHNAVERAQQIETGIVSSRHRLSARLAPQLGWTLRDFRDEICREHMFGAVFSPQHASLIRAPVVLMRVLAFLYADAIAYVSARHDLEYSLVSHTFPPQSNVCLQRIVLLCRACLSHLLRVTERTTRLL